MNKMESIVIGASLAVVCPLLTLVALWWGSAAIGMYVATVPDGVIKGAALVGLGAGVVGDVLFLKRWVAAFYTAKWAWVAAVYLGLSIIALAFCMGVPVGTFAVGVTGGVYLGRRLRHGHADGRVVSRALSRGALFASALTALLALPIGLMALYEPIVLRAAGALGLEARTVCGPAGQAVIIIMCLTLFALQFCSTRAAGLLAFGHSRLIGQQTAAPNAGSADAPPASVS